MQRAWEGVNTIVVSRSTNLVVPIWNPNLGFFKQRPVIQSLNTESVRAKS